jgi:hypothetical protein
VRISLKATQLRFAFPESIGLNFDHEYADSGINGSYQSNSGSFINGM